MMKLVVLLGVVGVALSAPVPEDGPAPAAVPHLLPYAAIYPYAGVPLLYAPLESGLAYPEALPYVHDPTGDVSDDSYPAAEKYVHDPTGDEA